MAETENQGAAPEAAAAEQPQQILDLRRCYLKDASLEMPHAPDILLQAPEDQPTVEFQFEVEPKALPVEGICEVNVRGTVTVKAKDSVLFLVECKQAGIFAIAGYSPEELQYLLNVYCPTVVYPYLRANMGDLISRTTLPTIYLPEVNFQTLYQQRLAQAQAQAAGTAN